MPPKILGSSGQKTRQIVVFKYIYILLCKRHRSRLIRTKNAVVCPVWRSMLVALWRSKNPSCFLVGYEKLCQQERPIGKVRQKVSARCFGEWPNPATIIHQLFVCTHTLWWWGAQPDPAGQKRKLARQARQKARNELPLLLIISMLVVVYNKQWTQQTHCRLGFLTPTHNNAET